MRKKHCVAMLLAGGQGSRLGLLTQAMAKPAVPFGGRYRIIDFPLSNCSNSHIDTVGVLTQYQPLALNRYIGTGQPWDLDISDGGVFVLPPYASASGADWYKGTANAIFQNFAFIEQYDPDYVLVLSGDHIYCMNYNLMLEEHIRKQADVTIAVRPVPIEEAHSFGIMTTDSDGRITAFKEKPKNPESNLASMGVYIFSWPVMKKYLAEDNEDPNSQNDFGKNIIPKLLADGKALYAYAFKAYWKDVGTIASLWEANMDLLKTPTELALDDPHWPIYSRSAVMPPHITGAEAVTQRSMIADGCEIFGTVTGSVISNGTVVEKGATVRDCFIMPGVRVCSGAVVERAIVGEDSQIGTGAKIGAPEGDITLIGPGTCVPEGRSIPAGVQANNDTFAAGR